LAADVGILAILPEPTSIENSYRFIKAAYYRKLSKAKNLEDIHSLIEAAMDPQNQMAIRSPSELFREVNRTNPDAAMRLKREIEKFHPKLIVNQARTQADIEIGNSVKAVCKKYFGVEVDYLGHLDYDSAVWQSVRRKRPLLLEFPNSRLVASLDQMTRSVLKRHGK
jgi:flagellar biosynthesis protein FlhG